MAETDWDKNLRDVVGMSNSDMLLSNAGLKPQTPPSPHNAPPSGQKMPPKENDEWKFRIIVPFASHHFGAAAGTRNQGLGTNMGIGVEGQYAPNKSIELGIYESSYSGALVEGHDRKPLRDKHGNPTGKRYGKEYVTYLAHNWETSVIEGNGYTIKAGISAGITHGYASHLPSAWQKYAPGGIVPMVAPSLSINFNNNTLTQMGISDVGIKARLLPGNGEIPIALSFQASF